MEKTLSRYTVGGWTIDPKLGLAQSRDKSIHLEPKVAELLTQLASRSGDVVSRAELLESVWPEVTVGDEVITNAVAKLRRALEDDPRRPKLIETIPKRGYRVVASVDKVPALASSAPTRPPWLWIAPLTIVFFVAGMAMLVLTRWVEEPGKTISGGVTPPQPEKTSIAVLPFANLSSDQDQEYFSDGLAEDLLTDLSKVSALRVISRTTTFAYKGKTPDVRAVAKELGVSHVIEGSVRKANGRVRITAKLTDARNGVSLWAERYDHELGDIFTLQDEVRGKIFTALAIRLAPGEQQRLSAKGTQNVEAYDLFLKGRFQESSFTPQGIAAAIRYYQQAIEIDSDYANAYARMANMYDFTVRFGWSDNNERDRSKAFNLADKALKLDENNPYAHWTQGRILSRLGPRGIENQHRAIRSLERAIELDASYADAYAFISLLYIGIGMDDEAVNAVKAAMTLNPQYPFWYAQNRAIIYYMQGDYSAAIADFERAAEQNPTAVFLRYWLAAAYALADNKDEADWQLEEMQNLGFHRTVGELVTSMAIIHHPPYVDRFRSGLRKAGLPE